MIYVGFSFIRYLKINFKFIKNIVPTKINYINTVYQVINDQAIEDITGDEKSGQKQILNK